MTHILQPTISIITPSFNSGNFIERCIQSVIIQNYPGTEHIVMDGGSKDGTLSILNKYRDKVRWVSEPDHGQADAMNKGIRIAKGEIIGWINADDYYSPDVIQTIVQEFVSRPEISMVHGNGRFEDLDGKLLREVRSGPSDTKSILLRNQVFYPAFVRKAVFNEIGYFDEALHFCMDYDMWIRIIMRYKTKHLPIRFAVKIMHPQTKSVFNSYDMTLEADKVKWNHLNKPETKKVLGDDYLKLKQFCVWELGWFNYQSLNLNEARKWLLQAVWIQPVSAYGLRALIVVFFSLFGKNVANGIMLTYRSFLNPGAKKIRAFGRYLRGKHAPS